MALYAALDPVAALKKWSEIRQKDPSTLTPEEKNDISGNMTGLAAENPQAWQAVKTGINDNGTSKDIFNPSTFSWEKQEDHGFWSHPESWLQLGFGGAVGGIGAASLLGGAALGPSTAADIAGTSAAEAAPSGIAAGGAGRQARQGPSSRRENRRLNSRESGEHREDHLAHPRRGSSRREPRAASE